MKIFRDLFSNLRDDGKIVSTPIAFSNIMTLRCDLGQPEIPQAVEDLGDADFVLSSGPKPLMRLRLATPIRLSSSTYRSAGCFPHLRVASSCR